MQPKFVIYELNEIPPFVFDYAAERYPHSAFAEIKRRASIRTETVDRGVLSSGSLGRRYTEGFRTSNIP